ncbi:hypothetical protein SRHO_G00208130 [Serrasalmus rhombeus]
MCDTETSTHWFTSPYTTVHTEAFSQQCTVKATSETPAPLLSYSQGRDLPTGTRSPFAQTSTNHIHLVSGPEEGNETSWQQGQMCFCKNTSLLLKDNRVKITVGGFYYIYAQVSFKQVDKGTVTVIANENILDKTPRKLIEAQQHSPGTVSMSGVILLKKGDSVKLAIRFKSMLLLKDESQTHWGLFLFARQQDY